MADERMRMGEDEIEALLRRQPRRMPSPELWARLAAEVAPAPRAGSRRVWAGALALAVAATFGLWFATRPAPQPQRTVIANAPAPQVQAQPAVPQRVAVVEQASPSKTRPRTHVLRVAHPDRAVAPKVEVSDAATPGAPPTAVAEKTDESSYYLEVSQGDRSSVLSGSVTRDAADRVTRISIAYDPGDGVDTKSAN